MKKVTTITAIITMAALVFTLSACGAENQPSSNNSEQTPVEQSKPEEPTPTSYPTIAAAIDAAKQADGSTFATQPILISGTVTATNDSSHSVALYDGDMASMAVVTFKQDEALPEKGSNARVQGYISRITDNGDGKAQMILLYKASEVK